MKQQKNVKSNSPGYSLKMILCFACALNVKETAKYQKVVFCLDTIIMKNLMKQLMKILALIYIFNIVTNNTKNSMDDILKWHFERT